MTIIPDPDARTRWNRVMNKLRTRAGAAPTLGPSDLPWLEQISAAAVGFHEIARAAAAVVERLSALLPDDAEARALQVKLAEYGYIESVARSAARKGDAGHD